MEMREESKELAKSAIRTSLMIKIRWLTNVPLSDEDYEKEVHKIDPENLLHLFDKEVPGV